MWLVVGTMEYLDRFGSKLAGFTPQLFAPYPNPARRSLIIRYQLSTLDAREVRFSAHDLGGRLVWTCVAGSDLSPGNHCVSWNGRNIEDRDIAPGVYVLTMQLLTREGAVRHIGKQRVTFLH
jgi:hypothetical protein